MKHRQKREESKRNFFAERKVAYNSSAGGGRVYSFVCSQRSCVRVREFPARAIFAREYGKNDGAQYLLLRQRLTELRPSPSLRLFSLQLISYFIFDSSSILLPRPRILNDFTSVERTLTKVERLIIESFYPSPPRPVTLHYFPYFFTLRLGWRFPLLRFFPSFLLLVV